MIDEDEKPASRMQRILSLSSSLHHGLSLNSDNSTFLATLNIDPPVDHHPVEELIFNLQMLLHTGLTIDSKFALHVIFAELSSELPPLTSVDRDFPTSHREVVHYALVPRAYQLIKVKPGQKDALGREKKQPNIYAIVRIFSAFSQDVIMRYLLPDLDILGLRLNVKNVQIPDTEITIIMFGVHPAACPEGFKAMLIHCFKIEADALVKSGEITKIERGELQFDNMFPKVQGIKSTELKDPEDRAKYNTDKFLTHLRRGMVIETPTATTKQTKAFIDSA